MDITSLLQGQMGKTIIKNVTNQLGLNESQAASAINTAIPAIIGGINKNVQSTEGAASLDKALQKHDGTILDNLVGMLGNSQELQKDGSGILGHIFGNKQNDVAKSVSKRAGINTSQASSILAILAPIVMGFLGKEKKQTKSSASDLGGLVGGLLGSSGKSGGILDTVTNLLDKDKDGSVLDDIFDMFKK